MFLLNKNNYGYISPEEFNTYCNLAQLDMFENLFFQYNQWLAKQNRRMTETEYANIPKNIREQIDMFATYTTESNFVYDEVNDVWNYTGNDLYRVENISLVNTQGKKIDIEEVNKSELNRLKNGNLISLTYPAYEKIGESFRIHPTLDEDYYPELFFLRTPKAPKWTYVNVSGNPVYNASATDKQDIELHISQYAPFVMKVLSYCGISVREEQIEAATNNEEVKIAQKQS
jgi:hypothetical protein